MKLHIKELSRRGVFKTLVAYAVAAWVGTEVTSVIAPAFLLPDWMVAAVTTAFVLGAFPVLLLSWRYDLTRAGVKRDTSVLSESAEKTARIVSAVVVFALLGTTAMLWLNYFRARSVDEVQSLVEAQRGAPEIGSEGRIQSIAVLPFDDFSPSGGRSLLADGIAEAVLHALAQSQDLLVTARTSSFFFRDKDMTATEIGRILNVQALLEGSVQVANDELRVTSQLVRTSDQSHLWSNVYQAPLEDIFDVQDAIANEVRRLVLPEKGAISRAAYRPSLEAYELLLEGRQLVEDARVESLDLAIRLINLAIRMSPDYADAHAWLGKAYLQKSETLKQSHSKSDREIQGLLEASRRSAENALEQDEHNALAILMLGDFESHSSAGLHPAVRKALELAPNDPGALARLSDLMRYSMALPEARELQSRARSVNPADHAALGGYLYASCGFETLLPQVEEQLASFPATRRTALFLRAIGQLCDGRHVEAAASLVKLAQVDNEPGSTRLALIYLASLGHEPALAQLGAAHRLLPRTFNERIYRMSMPVYFPRVLDERLDTWRGHVESEFSGRNTVQQYANALIMSGDYSLAEKLLEQRHRAWQQFYAAEGGRFWQKDTFEVQSQLAWLKSQRGQLQEAAQLSRELGQAMQEKGIARWSDTRGDIGDLPLMVLLLNDQHDQAVDWLREAESDQWLAFQVLLTSPVYREFRQDPEVGAILASMVDRRAQILEETLGLDVPEISDPSLLLARIEALVAPTPHLLARIALQFDNDPVTALAHYESAVSQEPDNPAILSDAADLVRDLGFVGQAIAMAERSVELSPDNAETRYMLGFNYACDHRWEDAQRAFERSAEQGAGYANRWVGQMMILKGDAQGALKFFKQMPRSSGRTMGLAMAYHALGQTARSDKAYSNWIDGPGPGLPVHTAYLAAFRGQADEAFQWLAEAESRGDGNLGSVPFNPLFQNLHDDPRWPQLLERIGKSPEQLAGLQFQLNLPE